MKAFILIEDREYEPFEIIGVYLNEEKARNAMLDLMTSNTKETDDSFDETKKDDLMKEVYDEYPGIFQKQYKILEYEITE